MQVVGRHLKTHRTPSIRYADAAAGEYDKYNDIKQVQVNNNYQYDAIGNLIVPN